MITLHKVYIVLCSKKTAAAPRRHIRCFYAIPYMPLVIMPGLPQTISPRYPCPTVPANSATVSVFETSHVSALI